MKDETKEIKISKSNHSIVIIKNGVTVKEQFVIDDEILDYITNLQEENKKLEEDNYELQKYINEEEGFVKDENRELGLRIDEAVEYNNKNIHSQTLNNILQGSDKDDRLE